MGVKKQKPGWRLRTRAARRQTTAAAAIDRAVIERQHRVGGDRQNGDDQEIGRMANRKEIV